MNPGRRLTVDIMLSLERAPHTSSVQIVREKVVCHLLCGIHIGLTIPYQLLALVTHLALTLDVVETDIIAHILQVTSLLTCLMHRSMDLMQCLYTIIVMVITVQVVVRILMTSIQSTLLVRSIQSITLFPVGNPWIGNTSMLVSLGMSTPQMPLERLRRPLQTLVRLVLLVSVLIRLVGMRLTMRLDHSTGEYTTEEGILVVILTVLLVQLLVLLVLVTQTTQRSLLRKQTLNGHTDLTVQSREQCLVSQDLRILMTHNSIIISTIRRIRGMDRCLVFSIH